jgi:hypothetical protein
MSTISREDIEMLWERLDREERDWKMATHALVELERVYDALDADGRRIFDELLPEWMDSDNEGKRFAAEGLAYHFRIRSLLPSVQSQLRRIAGAVDGPSVDRREWLEELVARLEEG